MDKEEIIEIKMLKDEVYKLKREKQELEERLDRMTFLYGLDDSSQETIFEKVENENKQLKDKLDKVRELCNNPYHQHRIEKNSTGTEDECFIVFNIKLINSILEEGNN